MSHITAITLKIRGLDDLETAATECGLELVREQTTHKWYGRFVGDTAGIDGVAREEYGKCLHALRLPNAGPGDYEIGVCAARDGDGFELRVDTWRQTRLLAAVGGADMPKLKQEYAIAVTKRRVGQTLARKGFVFAGREALANGRVRMLVRKR